ncbi:MAG: hypothetical protein RLZZ584_1251 [Pseudomonadota bacterium]|jgi:cell division protein FtsQ
MSSTTASSPNFAAQASGGRGVSSPADVAPWEDELPWTDIGQATPQPYREPGAAAATVQETAATQAAPEPARREQAARDRAAQERAGQEQAALAWAAQHKAAQDLAARERAAQQRAEQERAAREQAARDQAERERAGRAAAEAAEREATAARQAARRESSARKRAADKAVETAAAARATDTPRFEQARRPSSVQAAGEPLLRDSGGGGAPGNPVDQALAQALDLRLMRLASRTLVALAVLALLGWGLVWLASGPWFAFRRLTLQGDVGHNSVEALRSQVLSQLHGGYFTLDLQAAQAAFESSPWVRKAQVKRVWPDRLVVRIEEHQPRAVWKLEDEEDQLVNAQGEVFEGNAAELDDSVAQALPVLSGPAGSALQMLTMRERLAPVFAALQFELTRLELSERGSWRATLANRAVIELGRGEPAEIEQRTRRFVATVGEVSARFGHRAVESADLRHQEGYALKLVGMGTTTRPAGPGNKGR